MISATKGIVLKNIKYGDTSLIAYIFTESFGLQTYLVKGARNMKGGKANLLQPGAVLDLIVYHQPNKNFQIIKEMNPDLQVMTAHENVMVHCVSLFCMEALLLLLNHAGQQEVLFDFVYAYLNQLSSEKPGRIANYPLFFIIHTAGILGYKIAGNFSERYSYLDLKEGRFTDSPPVLPPVITGEDAQNISMLNQLNDTDLLEYTIPADKRNTYLQYFLWFLEMHAPGFKALKSLPVLSAIMH